MQPPAESMKAPQFILTGFAPILGLAMFPALAVAQTFTLPPSWKYDSGS